MSQQMSNDQYAMTQQGLMLLAALAVQYDFDAFLQRIATAHAIAPVFDPTLYRNGMANLEAIEKLARAAAKFRKAAALFTAEVAGQGGKVPV